ncbi:MAG: CDP-diacylglycerol--serine O-phosphatidyltransferase [Peptococcaceae bacterium]|jgi:CDP-diacylglycerol--serine O-phosphatidyltransferase|nr:CDP-diacylglycerol--serine O-phosphatidyltransferase [Peptococcaceae bacterium]MDH7525715.1 CDP-diacylglycerol--serine O-phosphatidyltransferase [Peptococcaceae bacterium]
MDKKLIPNIITLVNLVFGITSLWFTMEGHYKEAAVAILFGMVLDGMDGRLARRLKVTSDFGKELDSLADLVSFGVAPALLTYASILNNMGYLGLIISTLFALCGAIRLARFNVLNIKTYFVGVPITFAGPMMAIFVLLSNRLPLGFYAVASIVLSYLMISNIKVPKY